MSFDEMKEDLFLFTSFPGGTMVKNPPAKGRRSKTCRFDPWVEKIPWRRYPLEENTHSSILAWRIPWTEEPGRLESIESHRVRHDRSDFTYTHIPLQLTPSSTAYSKCPSCLLWLNRIDNLWLKSYFYRIQNLLGSPL